MVSLRIQEFLDARGLSQTDLSSLTGIAENTINTYATESFNLDENTAQDIRTIASKLGIPAAKLIRPVDKKPGIRLKILEEAKAQGLTLNQVAESSQVDPSLLAIYSTQVILKEKLEEAEIQDDLNNIATALGSSLSRLSVAEEPPRTQLRLNEFLQEKGISLEDLSLIYNVPLRFFDLLEGQPFDPSALGAEQWCCALELSWFCPTR
jgi:hypothetical protein